MVIATRQTGLQERGGGMTPNGERATLVRMRHRRAHVRSNPIVTTSNCVYSGTWKAVTTLKSPALHANFFTKSISVLIKNMTFLFAITKKDPLLSPSRQPPVSCRNRAPFFQNRSRGENGKKLYGGTGEYEEGAPTGTGCVSTYSSHKQSDNEDRGGGRWGGVDGKGKIAGPERKN